MTLPYIRPSAPIALATCTHSTLSKRVEDFTMGIGRQELTVGRTKHPSALSPIQHGSVLAAQHPKWHSLHGRRLAALQTRYSTDPFHCRRLSRPARRLGLG